MVVGYQRPARFEGMTLEAVISYRDICKAYCEKDPRWAEKVGFGCVLMADAWIAAQETEAA